jgi:hypothetical protein
MVLRASHITGDNRPEANELTTDAVSELTNVAEEVCRLKERIERAQQAECARVLRDPTLRRIGRAPRHER